MSTFNELKRHRRLDTAKRFGELTGAGPEVPIEFDSAVHPITPSRLEKQDEVEAELEALKRQLGS